MSLIKMSSNKRSSSLSSMRSNLGFLPICFSFQSTEQPQSELIIKTNNNNTLGASYLVGARWFLIGPGNQKYQLLEAFKPNNEWLNERLLNQSFPFMTTWTLSMYVLMWNGAPKTKFSLPEKKQWSRSLVELGAALDACGTLVMMWVQLSI